MPDALKDSQAFKNLASLIEEQTDDSHSPKDDKGQSAGNMQNPSEPDATYRRKGNKTSVGYTLNIVEARDNEKGSLPAPGDLRRYQPRATGKKGSSVPSSARKIAHRVRLRTAVLSKSKKGLTR